MDNLFLLQSTVITGGQEGTATTTNTTTPETQQPADVGTTPAPSGVTTYGMLAIWAVLIVGMYWFSMRSTKKREQAILDKQNSMKLGDDVVTTSGMHGKIVDISDSTFSIEFGVNKGIIVPVNKRDVLPVNLNLDAKPAKKAKGEDKSE